MKTRKFALALLALAFTVSASATRIPQLSIKALDHSKAMFSALIDPTEPSEIIVQDENGNTVYYKESKAAPEVSTVFNLSELENGVYTFQVKTGSASAIQTVKLHNGEVEIRDLKKHHDPYFANNEERMKVAFLNFEGKKMTLRVYKNNEMIFETGMGNSFVVQKSFDISELKSGVYDVVLVGGNEAYSYKLRL